MGFGKITRIFKAVQKCGVDDFWGNHHKTVQNNWNFRKKSKFLEEFDTGSLYLQPELSVYFKCPVLKLKDEPLKFYRDDYNHKNSGILKVATKYLEVMVISVPSERVFSITGDSQ
ncbi:hypothetical protein NPIL_363871 [Nephila pilipes]|uniref:HAT C-terminal dimerisation domain-containing protein n=1 Tax=Nephila pilipes TaxID=299642 RepID=A0A8X6R280_NEPPI|nr:hypothetical protein NPIL_363871 [Nephila pilipes]